MFGWVLQLRLKEAYNLTHLPKVARYLCFINSSPTYRYTTISFWNSSIDRMVCSARLKSMTVFGLLKRSLKCIAGPHSNTLLSAHKPIKINGLNCDEPCAAAWTQRIVSANLHAIAVDNQKITLNIFTTLRIVFQNFHWYIFCPFLVFLGLFPCKPLCKFCLEYNLQRSRASAIIVV